MMDTTEVRGHDDEVAEQLRVRAEVASQLAAFRRRVAGRDGSTVAELLEETRSARMDYLAGAPIARTG